MTHFIERKHMLQWLAKNCTRKSVVRAMDEGIVEHLGAFANLGPNKDPGWVVKVMSSRNKVWFVEVVASVHSKSFGIFISKGGWKIPWEDWSGGAGYPHSPDKPLYSGDFPIEYRRLRDERRAEIEEENRASENTEQESESKG